MRRIAILLLLLTIIVFADNKYFYPAPIQQTNGRPINNANVDLYTANTTTKVYDLTYLSNSPGLYYHTSSFTEGSYDVYVNGVLVIEDVSLGGALSTADAKGIVGDSLAALSGFNGIVYTSRQFGQKIVKDTTVLNSYRPDSVSTMVYLRQRSSSDTTGGGWFIYNPTHTIDTTYDKGIVFNGWIRESYLRYRTVNIEDFGAIADNGTTDSRAAIQAVIDFLAVNGGGVCYIPAVFPNTGAYYKVTKATGIGAYAIEVKPYVTIRGVGAFANQGSRIKLADSQDSCWVFGTTAAVYHDTSGLAGGANWAHGTRIEGIKIDCNGTNQTKFAGGINFDQPGEASAMRDIVITNVKAIETDGEAGFRMTLGAPGDVTNISVFSLSADSQSCGFELTGSASSRIGLISGDNNWPFIRHLGGRYEIGHIKVEYSSVPAETAAVVLTKSGFTGRLNIHSGYINASAESDSGIALKVMSPDAANISSGLAHIQNAGLKWSYINSFTTDTLLTTVAGQSFRGVEWGLGTAFRYVDGDIRFANNRNIEYYDDQGTARTALGLTNTGVVTYDARLRQEWRVGNSAILQAYSNKVDVQKELKAIGGLRIGGDPYTQVDSAQVENQVYKIYDNANGYGALRYLEGIQFYPATADSFRLIFTNPTAAAKDTSAWIGLH